MVECYFLGYKAILDNFMKSGVAGHCECGRIASGTQFQTLFKANVKRENIYDFYSTKNISKLILKNR
jgi:hypothetical protein